MSQEQKKDLFEMIYEGFMVVFAFIAVATIWYQTKYDSFIIWGTWSIFFVDFLVRIYKSANKLDFLKRNPFIVIAVIPLDAIFQMARVARILHFMRLKVITKHYTKPMIATIRKQRFSYVVPGIIVILFISMIPLYFFEPALENYFDAFVGGAASLVFFGYSTINPQTNTGTVTITLLTFLGVIMHAVIISYLLNIIRSLEFVKKWIIKPKDKKRHIS